MPQGFDPKEKTAIWVFIGVLLLIVAYFSTHEVPWNSSQPAMSQGTSEEPEGTLSSEESEAPVSAGRLSREESQEPVEEIRERVPEREPQEPVEPSSERYQ